MAEGFEQKVQRACKHGEIPGVVLFAGDREGKLKYEKAYGYHSLKDKSNPNPMPLDATMWMASCSKLVTAIAAMQCVEKGLFTLDDDVTRIVPELKDLQILEGFENGPDGKEKAILVPNTKTITLRQLLTHSSGLGYDIFNPVLMRYRATENPPFTPALHITGPVVPAYTFPLLFSPGSAWEYGVGIDWAGWMVERATSTTLEAYINAHIWAPLSVKSMTFYPLRNPATTEKLTDMSDRAGGVTAFGTAADPDGKLAYTQDRIWNPETDGCSGGAGIYGAPKDYYKVLYSILTNDGKLLKSETIDEMFKPQLSEAVAASLMEKHRIPEVNMAMGGLPLGTKVNFGLGGEIIMNDLGSGRRKGTMGWGGYPNLLWFIDRDAGIAGILGTQISPPGDAKVIGLFEEWEKEIYGGAVVLKL